MKNNIKESAEFYREVERLVLVTAGIRIFDLGCGAGLELDEIFRLNTTARVACVDLPQKMLEILRIKHEDRLDNLNLITGSYFKVDLPLPSEEFDVAISVQSMHHFGYKQKLSLYKKILHSLGVMEHISRQITLSILR